MSPNTGRLCWSFLAAALLFAGCGQQEEAQNDSAANAPASRGIEAAADATAQELREVKTQLGLARSERDDATAQLEAAQAALEEVRAELQAVEGIGAGEELTAQTDTQKALMAMGFSMAQQLGLTEGFSDVEMAFVYQGMRDAIAGKEQYDDFDALIGSARSIYAAKRQEAREAEMEAATEKEVAYFEILEDNEDVQKSDSGLYYEILEPGNEVRATPADRVKVHYRGTLLDGTEFDSSYGRGEPATFGVTRVVKGFSEGVRLVGEGGKVRLHIPAELGYGDNPPPGSSIKPGSTLVFEVEMIEIIKPEPKAESTAETPKRPPNLPPNFTPPPPPPNFTPPPPPSGPPPTSRPPGSTPPPPPSQQGDN